MARYPETSSVATSDRLRVLSDAIFRGNRCALGARHASLKESILAWKLRKLDRRRAELRMKLREVATPFLGNETGLRSGADPDQILIFRRAAIDPVLE